MSKGVIICVDDERLVLHSLKLELRNYLDDEYEIEIAESGEEALEIFAELRKEQIDIPLIICDQIMPGMKGDELIIKIHSQYPKTLTVLLTGQASADAVGNALNSGNLYRYIAKPWEKTDLCLTVTEALRSYFQDKQLDEKNKLLQKNNVELDQLNTSLEQKVAERNAELTLTNSQLQQEIAERKLLEKKLRSSEQQIRAIFESMSDIVLIIDQQGGITAAPTNSGRLYESNTDVLSLTIKQFYQEERSKIWFSKIREATKTQQTVNFHYSLPIGDQEVWFAASISPLPNNSVSWVARDITDVYEELRLRKQAEAAMQKAKEAADNANRAKSEFLSKMSHELRTPLNAILGFTQVMNRDKNLNSLQQEQLGIIKNSGEHLLNLINDVLEMSKIESGRATLNENNFDLYGLLNKLDQMLQIKAQSKGLHLIFDYAPDLPQYVRTDEVKLRQVLINLIVNAIKFTASGGVALRVGWGIKNEEGVIKNGEETNSKLYSLSFEVEDTGTGLTTDEIETLFEPFLQTKIGKNAQEGTGLGLPISRQFVQLMGGNITVSSTVGEGTIFKFNVNIQLASTADIETSLPTKRAIALAPNQPIYRILIVEDRWESRQLLVHLLSPFGFEVRQAENGQQGVALWHSWEPHLILMDMQMPVMDGYEATKQIKAHLKGQATIIIALTASVFEENRIIVMSAGCNDFIRKPFREEVLLEKIATHLGISYIYEELQPITTQPKKPQFELTPEALNVMSAEWIEQLYQAADTVNNQQIIKLLEQIPPAEAFLAQSLADLVKNFRCDQILELIEQYQGKDSS